MRITFFPINFRCWLLSAFLLLSFTQCGVLSKPPKQAGKNQLDAARKLLAQTWGSDHIIAQGRRIDINGIAGQVIMSFAPREKTVNGKKKMEPQFFMSMGGRERTFDYEVVEADSMSSYIAIVQFVNVKNFENIKVRRLTRDTLIFDQVVDNRLIKYTMLSCQNKAHSCDL